MPRLFGAEFYRHSRLSGLRKVTVRQKFGNHSLAFLDYRIEDHRDYLLPPENTPVQIQFGESPSSVRSLYAYVNHAETVSDLHDNAFTRLVCVGTSKVMNSVNTVSWQGQTRSGIVRDIATEHRLRSVVHEHPHVVDNWATGMRTDFQALRALAEEAGYRLWVDGSTVWFLDPTKILRTATSMSTPIIPARDLRKVQVLSGSSIPGEMTSSTRHVQYGLDYRTNEFFAAMSGDPSRPTGVGASSVNTFAEAQEVTDASERVERDQFVLKATIDGDARLAPGTPVRFLAGRVNKDQAGLWMVDEAEHEITGTDFLSRIVASRGADPIRLSTTTRGAAGVVPALIRDGKKWEAALQERVYV